MGQPKSLCLTLLICERCKSIVQPSQQYPTRGISVAVLGGVRNLALKPSAFTWPFPAPHSSKKRGESPPLSSSTSYGFLFLVPRLNFYTHQLFILITAKFRLQQMQHTFMTSRVRKHPEIHFQIMNLPCYFCKWKMNKADFELAVNMWKVRKNQNYTNKRQCLRFYQE